MGGQSYFWGGVDALEDWNMSQKSSPYSWLLAHKGKWKSPTFSDTLLIRFCWCTSATQSRNLRCQSWSQHFYLAGLFRVVLSSFLEHTLQSSFGNLCQSFDIDILNQFLPAWRYVPDCYYIILHSFCMQLRSWSSSQGNQLNLISLGKVPPSRSILYPLIAGSARTFFWLLVVSLADSLAKGIFSALL